MVAGRFGHRWDYSRLGEIGALRRSLSCFYPFFGQESDALDYRDLRRKFVWSEPSLGLGAQATARGNAKPYVVTDQKTKLTVTDAFANKPGKGTVSLWFHMDSDDSNLVPMVIIGKTFAECVFMGWYQGYFAIGANSVTAGITDLILIDSPVSTRQWNHIAWVADGGPWRMYVNGIERVTFAALGTNSGYWADVVATISSDVWGVLADQTYLASNCDFSFHELGIWERVLSDAEIRQLAKNPDSLYPTKTFVHSWGHFQQIVLSGIASTEALGVPELAHRFSLAGIASTEALGLAELAHRFSLAGIASTEAFGLPELVHRFMLSGIASAEALGLAELVHRLTMTGIASAEALGLAELVHRLSVSGIATSEALGTPSLAHALGLSGIASAEALGVAELVHRIQMQGVASAEALGLPSLASLLVFSGVAASEAVGIAELVHRLAFPGIVSGEALGLPRIAGAVVTSTRSFEAQCYFSGVDSPAVIGRLDTAEATLGGLAAGATIGTGVESNAVLGGPIVGDAQL